MAQINKPNEYFNTITWTGDSTTPKNIEGVGFQPDLIWGKIRSKSYSNQIYDTVRGFGNDKELTPDNTNAEGGTNAEIYGYLSAVTSDGFTAVKGTDVAGYDYWNESPDTYVAWNWLANGAGVSNTDGDITSTVSANTTSGFSIVKWTGNGIQSDQEIGTGLSTELKFVISKPLTTGGTTNSWVVYVNGVTDAQNNCLLLETTDALITGASGGTPNKGTTAGNLLIKAGTASNNNLNNSGTNYIAYCFSEVKGFSKFGTYTGNANADGTFVYTGFKPAYVMMKSSSNASTPWNIFDNKRDGYNVTEKNLQANSGNVEDTGRYIDFLSNGFKIRNGGTEMNGLGYTYIYMAFAENPLVGTNGVPATAR